MVLNVNRFHRCNPLQNRSLKVIKMCSLIHKKCLIVYGINEALQNREVTHTTPFLWPDTHGSYIGIHMDGAPKNYKYLKLMEMLWCDGRPSILHLQHCWPEISPPDCVGYLACPTPPVPGSCLIPSTDVADSQDIPVLPYHADDSLPGEVPRVWERDKKWK